jgi:hypothetical protein
MLFALFAGATAMGVVAAGQKADEQDATQQQILAELKALRERAENEEFCRERGLPFPTRPRPNRMPRKSAAEAWATRNDPPAAAPVEEMSEEDDLTKDPRFLDAPE